MANTYNMDLANKPLSDQTEGLLEIMSNHEHISSLMNHIQNKMSIENWYIGGGCIPTITWNKLVGNPINEYLNDIDIIYYDSDLSKDKEIELQNSIVFENSNIPFKIDLKNQARMHLWLENKYDVKIDQFGTSEEGMNNWLSVTSIGLSLKNNKVKIYAPYGLNDLFCMIVRPNKKIITEEHYNRKIRRWKSQWYEVNAIPWV